MKTDDYSKDEPWLQSQCTLGEGPFYHSGKQELMFIDLRERKFHSVNTNNGPSLHKQIQLDTCISVLAEIEGRPDELMVTTKTGFSIFNTGSGELREVKRVLSDERSAARLRFNDGAVDAKGRFWAGTMTDFHIGEVHNEGTLWRLDPNLSLHRMIDNITVPNGIGWSPDNETMYFADSAPKIVWAYDFDLSSGSISNRRIFYEHDGRPNPDGLCIDSNGGIWLALWEGNRVINISPTGEVMREIVLPAWRVTCPVFGGVEFDELFITTATHDLKSYVEGSKVDGMRDFGGSVFRVHVGIKGLRKNKFVSEV